MAREKSGRHPTFNNKTMKINETGNSREEKNEKKEKEE